MMVFKIGNFFLPALLISPEFLIWQQVLGQSMFECCAQILSMIEISWSLEFDTVTLTII